MQNFCLTPTFYLLVTVAIFFIDKNTHISSVQNTLRNIHTKFGSQVVSDQMIFEKRAVNPLHPLLDQLLAILCFIHLYVVLFLSRASLCWSSRFKDAPLLFVW